MRPGIVWSDALRRLLERVDAGDGSRLIVVTGRSARWDAAREQVLDSAPLACVVQRSSDSPEREEILATIAEVPESIDVVLAIGGGATMDFAKLVAAFVAAPQSASAPCGSWIVPDDGPVVAALPTTAGSGAEATPFAVVYEKGEKFSIAHERLLPRFVELDGVVCSAVPEPFANAAAGDVLAQSLESSWAVGGTDESRSIARVAFAQAWEATLGGLPARLEEWEVLAIAAHEAGRAIAVSRTTICHALSYRLTHHHGVPHGAAVCATLPLFAAVTVANSPLVLPSPLGRDPQDVAGQLAEHLRGLGLAPSLHELGLVDRDDVIGLAQAVNPERLGNYPVPIGPGRLEQLLLENAGPDWMRLGWIDGESPAAGRAPTLS